MRGSPETRSRPRISASRSSGPGNAEPRVILTSSAVASPSRSACSFFIQFVIARSSSSPAVRTLRLVTMPPRLITATSVVPPPTSTTMLPVARCTGQPGADRGGHRLLDDVDPAGAGLVAGLLDRPLLDRGDPARHADDHPRLGEVAAAVHQRDEVAQHLLGRLEVGDHAVLERPDRGDVLRRAPDHLLGVVPDRDQLAGLLVDRDHARLVDQDALAAHVDERVGGAQVHGHVPADEVVRHPSCPCAGKRAGKRDQAGRPGLGTPRLRKNRAHTPAGTPGLE